jgi:SAM-dependent methyltransferase
MSEPQGTGQRGGEGLPHDWDASYAGTPPWDIGRPQTPLVELADAGQLHGAVLDIGCGTGEHALLAAERGLRATGVDLAPTAIARARTKARQRGLDARFLVQDALTVDSLGETFDVVLDCGFFHVLPDPARVSLADVLRRVMAPGATYFLLCFSDRVPGDAGPRRIHQEEIRAAFADGFSVDSITESTIEATFLDVPVPAWLARITR